jgi:hypothetical protein
MPQTPEQIAEIKAAAEAARLTAIELQKGSIDATPRTATAPVSSGSGSPASSSKSGSSVTATGATSGGNAQAVKAGDFAYGALGNGTAGGLGNAALVDPNVILPNTKRTNISRAQLEAADHEYTQKMNILSQHWAVKDTSSPEYEAAKADAIQTQYKWELARNKLEETATAESTPRTITGITDDSLIDTSKINTDLNVDVPSLNDEAVPPEAPPADIVVEGHPVKDNRIRFRPKKGDEEDIYGEKDDSVLYLLHETDGVYFPYTPQIDFSHRANYNPMSPTHANTDYYVYNNTPAIQISISGQFSAQNLAEAKYTLAAMHFFRTVTKMHFGKDDEWAGLPPPVLNLSGYGDFMFNDLSVIVTEFKMDLPPDVDYLEVEIGDSIAWVPALTTFAVTCVVQNTPAQQRDEFNFAEFASGKLMKGFL